MSIRTTVSLDEDVLERVRDESRKRGSPFRDTLNELLRIGLSQAENFAGRESFRVNPAPVGLREGLSYDDVEALIEFGEGPHHR